jgi:hypothetical protein
MSIENNKAKPLINGSQIVRIFIIAFCFIAFWLMMILQVSPLTKYLCLGSAVFSVGFYGFSSGKSPSL